MIYLTYGLTMSKSIKPWWSDRLSVSRKFIRYRHHKHIPDRRVLSKLKKQKEYEHRLLVRLLRESMLVVLLGMLFVVVYLIW
jgi:hypothetical protein